MFLRSCKALVQESPEQSMSSQAWCSPYRSIYERAMVSAEFHDIRSYNSCKERAFPQQVRDFFKNFLPTDDEMVLRCYAFFKSLFSEVSERLHELGPTNSLTLALKWKNYLERENGEIRNQMCSSIVAVCVWQNLTFDI